MSRCQDTFQPLGLHVDSLRIWSNIVRISYQNFVSICCPIDTCNDFINIRTIGLADANSLKNHLAMQFCHWKEHSIRSHKVYLWVLTLGIILNYVPSTKVSNTALFCQCGIGHVTMSVVGIGHCQYRMTYFRIVIKLRLYLSRDVLVSLPFVPGITGIRVIDRMNTYSMPGILQFLQLSERMFVQFTIRKERDMCTVLREKRQCLHPSVIVRIVKRKQ